MEHISTTVKEAMKNIKDNVKIVLRCSICDSITLAIPKSNAHIAKTCSKCLNKVSNLRNKYENN